MHVSKKVSIKHFFGQWNGAIFNWASKVIRDYSVFALICSVIGPENSRHSLNQSDAKFKPITTWSPAFSRALGIFLGFTFCSHWLLQRCWIGCRKAKTKVTTKANQNKGKYLSGPFRTQGKKTTKLPKARENAGDKVSIAFSFANDWFKFWEIKENF